MRDVASRLALTCIAVGLLLSGFQTAAVYNSSPDSYGFYHIQGAYLSIAVSMTFFGLMLMLGFAKRLDRRLF